MAVAFSADDGKETVISDSHLGHAELSDLEERAWDVVVVGAGPAGAIAARQAARAGASVLLVDGASFPRRKVCGGCFSKAALAVLAQAGLESLPERLGGVPLDRFDLRVGNRQAALALRGHLALSRERFDAALAQEAVRSGVCFLPETRVSLDGLNGRFRKLKLEGQDGNAEVQARVVVAAGGLGGTLLQGEKTLALLRARRSRIGAGAVAEEAPEAYRQGTIYMACGNGGYVGLVRIEGGRLLIAAAMDPEFIRAQHGLGKAAHTILSGTGMPQVEGIERLPWQGTAPMTMRRCRVAIERLFVIGDSAGYVEPFTGEGIASALASGIAVTPLVLQAISGWEASHAEEWNRLHHRMFFHRQWRCRMISRLLRRQVLTRTVVSVLSRIPRLASPLVRSMHTPFILEAVKAVREV